MYTIRMFVIIALTCVSVISMDRQALSQIDAGTIVTIYFDGKKIVMAADSMAVSGNAAEPPSYSQCKLAALDKRIIFASVGADSWRDNNSLISIGSWDNITEARYAFYSALEHKDDDTLLGTVDRWGKLLMDHWNALYHINRSEVIWASDHGNGIIAEGWFGGRMKDGTMKLFAIDIKLNRRRNGVLYKGGDLTCPSFICASGLADIVFEYRDLLSDGARKEAERWAKLEPAIPPKDRAARKIIRLAELTIADAPVTGPRGKEVGGAIDAVEIDESGRTRWINLKDNCKAD